MIVRPNADRSVRTNPDRRRHAARNATSGRDRRHQADAKRIDPVSL